MATVHRGVFCLVSAVFGVGVSVAVTQGQVLSLDQAEHPHSAQGFFSWPVRTRYIDVHSDIAASWYTCVSYGSVSRTVALGRKIV
ncbi:hypothetical protein QR685DRAFT_429947 [Neurospora intermedia]|uniref:Uncharacterized protein n=1 Tax=Neurospora intermedia TaxID=5142 RepID=A0ABR3DS84_NEUIN